MRTLFLELRKQRRSGAAVVLPIAGALGGAYALVNFLVRGEALLRLPLDPMDILLTQLYGVILLLNLFGIVAAACMVYHIEFKGGAIQKMYLLPVSLPGMYVCKFLILAAALLLAVGVESLVLFQLGLRVLPQGTFVPGVVLRFAGYSFLTSLPVLSCMMLIASRFAPMWIPLGAGVAGFLSGMALASSASDLLLLHPFLVMLKPAVAMSTEPEPHVLCFALAETLVFLGAGLWTTKNRRDL